MSGCGFVVFHRKVTEWCWYKKPYMLRLFTHLILMANHRPQQWEGVTVERGQLVTGRLALSEQTGISQQSIRTCLTRLERTGEISVKSTNKFSIITICNYDKYQGQKNEANQQSTSNQPAINQQLTTNNNENNENKEETTMSSATALDPDTSPSSLEKNGVPVAKIIAHLNTAAQRDFKPAVKATRAKIKARWAEGHRLSDFLAVIDHKADEWLTDEKMQQYLRPETLFGTKFESYLVAAKAAGAGVEPKLRWNE
jgi:uncharacterized phage protein (TIGR02220 family)